MRAPGKMAGLLIGLLIGYACGARATDSELTPDTYAAAAELVRLDGNRAINLRCSGEGQPVVILEAGGNADSSTWYRVQPRLAGLTRVCAYDRAGYGFSDEGPMPGNLDARVDDLRALMDAADIPTPVLLVGHSLGSNIVRNYARRYPREVAGLVLVDPPGQGSDEDMPKDWREQIAAQTAHREEILDQCQRAAESGDHDTLRERCLRPPPTWMSEAVGSAMTQNKSKPTYWRTLRAEIAGNTVVFDMPVPVDESYGSIPLALLRAPEEGEDAPKEVLAVMRAARSQTHERILAASTRGIAIDVPDTSHDIQLEQPQAIVAAIEQMLGRISESDPDNGNRKDLSPAPQ